VVIVHHCGRGGNKRESERERERRKLHRTVKVDWNRGVKGWVREERKEKEREIFCAFPSDATATYAAVVSAPIKALNYSPLYSLYILFLLSFLLSIFSFLRSYLHIFADILISF
jgi:hypothetical protein